MKSVEGVFWVYPNCKQQNKSKKIRSAKKPERIGFPKRQGKWKKNLEHG
jgi:hypothetical protein